MEKQENFYVFRLNLIHHSTGFDLIQDGSETMEGHYCFNETYCECQVLEEDQI